MSYASAAFSQAFGVLVYTWGYVPFCGVLAIEPLTPTGWAVFMIVLSGVIAAISVALNRGEVTQ